MILSRLKNGDDGGGDDDDVLFVTFYFKILINLTSVFKPLRTGSHWS